MQGSIALILCIIFIIALYWLDFKRNPDVSTALWLALIWLILIGSRTIPQWLSTLGILNVQGGTLEGNVLDQFIIVLFMLAAIFILVKRDLGIRYIFNCNRWLFAWFLFCAVSTLWSDYTLIAMRKWIKGVASLLISLVVVTEPNPREALITLFKRCAFVLIPLSFLLIKYYPHIGIGWMEWGQISISGVAIGKNQLGRLCMICAFVFFWSVVTLWTDRVLQGNRREILLNIFFFLITVWLLIKSHSATSLGILIIAVALFAALGLPIVKRNRDRIEIIALLILLLGCAMEFSLNLTESFVEGLGRDMTFTERTYLWQDLLSMVTNPFLGTGYDSFWMGRRLATIESKQGWIPNEAHNGYLEIYLELGLFGLSMFLVLLICVYIKTRNILLFDFDFGRGRLTLFIMFILYNVTESAVKGDQLVWFMFLLLALYCPSVKGQTIGSSRCLWDGMDARQLHNVLPSRE